MVSLVRDTRLIWVNCKLLLHADDSPLIVPGKDVKEIED